MNENNSVNCLEKHIKELRQVREQYNKQLDQYIIELEKLKKKSKFQERIEMMQKMQQEKLKNMKK